MFSSTSPKAGGATDYLAQYRIDDDGAGFSEGLAVLMNSAKRNFHLYRWADLMP